MRAEPNPLPAAPSPSAAGSSAAASAPAAVAPAAAAEQGQGVKRVYVNKMFLLEQVVPLQEKLLLELEVNRWYDESGYPNHCATFVVSQRLLPVLPCLEKIVTNPDYDALTLTREVLVCVSKVAVNYTAEYYAKVYRHLDLEVVDEGMIKIEVREE